MFRPLSKDEIQQVVGLQISVLQVLQKNLVNELSKMILEGTVNKENEIVVDEKDGKLVFRNT
jgi:ATP-dependent Clp protease ATP-binding subunit ClpA